MIGYLKGTVLKNNGKGLLLNVNDVGYEVTVPVDTAVACPGGEKVELYTYLHVREDDMSLFGFETEEKLAFFKLLLTVSGIGPKMGIEILSLPITRVKQAVVEQDKTYLTTIKGMGDKLASRLLLELKNKVKLDFIPTGKSSAAVNPDVVSALENLGYDRNKIIKVLKEMETEIESEEELIKYALRNL